jgi:hypothetical protein
LQPSKSFQSHLFLDGRRTCEVRRSADWDNWINYLFIN